MDNSYVLFVKTGKEECIKEVLERSLDPNKHLPFIPSKIILFVKKSVKNKQNKYVFQDIFLLNQIVMQWSFSWMFLI